MLSSLPNPFARLSKSGAKAPAKGAKAAGPSRKAFLELRPVRNPALGWDEQDGVAVLRIEHKQSSNARSWKAKIAGIFVQLPAERNVELDALGTDVWKMLDGQTKVSAIVDALAKKHRLSKREAELSVQQYFKELSRRNYIAFLADEKKAVPKNP